MNRAARRARGARPSRTDQSSGRTPVLPRYQDLLPALGDPKAARRFAAEALAQKKRDFEGEREALDRAYEALPPEFRRRFDRFRRNNPEFRWRHEDYEMMVSQEAIKLAAALGTPEAVEGFLSLGPDGMRARVPELSWDAHTQKTFAWTAQFAHTWLTDPAMIEDECAVLCSMIGCAATGCGMGRYGFPARPLPN